jgi:hypothetical protein
MVKQLFSTILSILTIILLLENSINGFLEKLNSEIRKMTFMLFMRLESVRTEHRSILKEKLLIEEKQSLKYLEITVDLWILIM